MREAIASESGTQQQGKTPPTAPLNPTWLGPRPGGWADRLTGWVARHPRAPLLLAFALAIAARALLIVRTHAMIDGDEALVGIQAERILHGQFPTYFYLQPYMGSLEAYLAAALFRIFGPSSWALRAVPLLLSLPLVYLTWRLARALLPRDARTTPLLAGIAALFAAAPPLYDAVAELRTWGGQIEVYVVTLALLLCAVELADRLRAGAGSFELARRWAILGLFAGLGIWINPLVTYALAACALWLLPALIARAFPHLWARLLRRPAAVSPSAISAPASTPRATLTPLLALIPGLALGGLPAWLYAIQHSSENLLVFVSQPSVSGDISGAARHGRLFLGAAITARYATCVAPRALAGGLPAETLAWLPLRLALLLPPLLAIATALWLLRRERGADAGAVRAGLPLLYAGIITAVFCLGTSAWAATKPCERDWAGRYAVPLVLVEPFLLLALFAAPWAWTTLRRRAPNERTIRRGWSVALLVLLLGGALQLGTYTFASPSATFQSPYYPRAPLNTQPLLYYLNAHHITAAWCNHWLGNIVTFQTNGATTCADYYDQVYLHGLQRPPSSLQTVTNATAPSFILVGQGAHPLLAQELDAQNIPYTAAYIPASNVTIITPARTVDPATVIAGLAVDYPY